MAALIPNAVGTSNPITRIRKKRDLETTMNTLKHLLEPAITITSKKGSRKKNKPRSLLKKVPVPKKTTINRFENTDDDGEYYPNKLKRNDNMKKISLKPNQKLKVIVATNKRKRGTPHKGLKSPVEESSANIKANTLSQAELKVQTPPPNLNQVIKYELISPPHKSLTELTIDDLIRMDEDSLSDEELMEILTCPSPVWWEDPPDDFKQGALYILNTAENSPTEIIHGEKTTEANRQSNNNSNTNLTNVEISLKRTGTVSEIKLKAKKIAKLENILGHIKRRVQTDDKPTDDSDVRLKNDGYKADDDNDANDNFFHEMRETNAGELKDRIFSTDGSDTPNRRTLSSSCSDISVNEEDLLRNLENLDIPIQEQKNEDDLQNNVNGNDTNDVENDVSSKKTGDVNCIDIKCDVVAQDSTENIEKAVMVKNSTKQNKCVESVLDSNEQKPIIETLKVPEHESNLNDFHGTSKEVSGFKKKEVKCSDLKNKDILKKLKKRSDDILDVRLLQTPTNVINEVKICSKLDNFKRHNLKSEDFDNEVIDVEDKLEFSKIRSVNNSHIKERDPLESKSETIFIDDDDDSNDENLKLKLKDIIDLDAVEIINDFIIHTEIKIDDSSCHNEINEINTSKDTMKEALVNDKDIINEDTIRIGNVLDVRLIETTDILQNVMFKPKHKGKKLLGKGLKDPLQNYSNTKYKTTKLQGIKISPKETKETIQQSLKTPYPQESKSSRFTKNTYSKYIEQSNKDDKNQHDGILRIADTTEKITRLNDLSVALLKNPQPKHDFENSIKFVKKAENPVKKDLNVTLVNNNKNDVKGLTILPQILPKLTNNPTKTALESPKSVKSVTSVEYSEGTISDTNIQFLDEYEDNETIEKEYINKDSQSKPGDVYAIGENVNRTTDLDQNAKNKSITVFDRENKTGQNGFDQNEGNNSRTSDLGKDTKHIGAEYLDNDCKPENTAEEKANQTIWDGKNTMKYNDFDQNEGNNSTVDMHEGNKSIEEEYLDDDIKCIADEEAYKNILNMENKYLHDIDTNEGNNCRPSDLAEGNRNIEEEYLDDDSDKSIAEEEGNECILDEKNISRQDDKVKNEGNNFRPSDLVDVNQSIEEEYLDDDSDKSIAEEEGHECILDEKNISRQDDLVQNEGNNTNSIEVHEDNIEEEYLDDSDASIAEEEVLQISDDNDDKKLD